MTFILIKNINITDDKNINITNDSLKRTLYSYTNKLIITGKRIIHEDYIKKYKLQFLTSDLNRWN